MRPLTPGCEVGKLLEGTLQPVHPPGGNLSPEGDRRAVVGDVANGGNGGNVTPFLPEQHLYAGEVVEARRNQQGVETFLFCDAQGVLHGLFSGIALAVPEDCAGGHTFALSICAHDLGFVDAVCADAAADDEIGGISVLIELYSGVHALG